MTTPDDNQPVGPLEYNLEAQSLHERKHLILDVSSDVVTSWTVVGIYETAAEADEEAAKLLLASDYKKHQLAIVIAGKLLKARVRKDVDVDYLY